ncbi:MAG TPA: hypothetical protein VHC49_07565, partial [Mycobacteriales bacterium]|nr:hypothetical protein [Mycobacteriales bacterium]
MAGIPVVMRVAARRAVVRRDGDRTTALLYVLPAAALLVALLLYPLIDDVRLSLGRVSPGINDAFVGLRNYR